MKTTKPFQFFTILFASFLLWACDSAPEALPQKQALESQRQAELKKETEERLKKAERPIFVEWNNILEKNELFNFECEDCPPSIGQLITKQDGFMNDKDGKQVPAIISGNCQGGLIAEDLYLTSRHCLPKELQQIGASCEGQAQVIFPQTQKLSREIINCEHVVAFAPQYPGLEEKDAQPDWALLKLKKRLKKRFSDMSKDGIRNGQKLYAYIPLRSIDGQFFNLELLTCESIQNSIFLPEFQEEKSPLALVKCDKDMTKGFSGTLLFDGLGADAKAVATLTHIWDEGKGIDDIKISKNGILSNLSCANFEDDNKPTYCDFNPDNSLTLKQKITRRALKKAYEKSLTAFEDWMNKTDTPIRWSKTSPENIETLPNIYSDYVKRRLKERNDFVPQANRELYIRSILPYYAECVEDKKQQEMVIPALQMQILRNDKGQLYAEPKLVEHSGRLHHNDGEGRYVTLYTGEPQHPEFSINFHVTGYFSHHVYVKPCE